MQVLLNTSSIDSYRQFLTIKQLPVYSIRGRVAEFPDEYAQHVAGISVDQIIKPITFKPASFLFDYQRDIAKVALRKRKFAIFADPGLGKTLMAAEWSRHVLQVLNKQKCLLWVSPLMVVRQTIEEIKKFYGQNVAIQQIPAARLGEWLSEGDTMADGKKKARFGITNYEAIREDLPVDRLGALVCDESSILRSHYGAWGTRIIRMGRGLDFKLCLTGTPAPNDRIEYANHAVFLDQFPTVNSFLARYFINRGQTGERWEIKPHALSAFYRSLSHWCIFLTNPATYGWTDNVGNIPPIHTHIHEVELTPQQEALTWRQTGRMFLSDLGGITKRARYGQIAKGFYKDDNGRQRRIDTNKPGFIKSLVDSWSGRDGFSKPAEATLIWCIYNEEQKIIDEQFPGAASLYGNTPYDLREMLVNEFKAGQRMTLVTKPKILGFGLNLQVATRQVFSGLQDSYEQMFQAVKRSNRVGSTRPLNVHIPVTEIERPMLDTVLKKAKRVQADTEEQEKEFKRHGYFEA